MKDHPLKGFGILLVLAVAAALYCAYAIPKSLPAKAYDKEIDEKLRREQKITRSPKKIRKS